MRIARCLLVLAAAGLVAGCAAVAAPEDGRFEIGLIGDLPYSADDEARFPRLLAAMDAAPLAFVVHVGDIHFAPGGHRATGSTAAVPCRDETYDARRALFNGSRHPFVLTPGDNDWADCHEALPPFDPLERLERLRAVFFAGERSLGRRSIPLARQSTDPRFAAYRENVRWSHGGVLFVTLHTVGGNDNLGRTPEGDAEHAARRAANLAWLRASFALAKREGHAGLMILTQANPFFEDRWDAGRRAVFHIQPPPLGADAHRPLLDVLEGEVLAFGRPVAFVHGDTHSFRVDKPLFAAADGRLLESFTRAEVFGSPEVHWLRVTVDPADRNLFRFAPELLEPAAGEPTGR